MFISSPREILEAAPSARFDGKAAEKLLRSIEEEEEQLLEPLLGERLLCRLGGQYAGMVRLWGGISTDKIQVVEEDEGELLSQASAVEALRALDSVDKLRRTIQLLRCAQCALVYRMLSNKTYSLSTSWNIGGGASRAGAGDYEPADDRHLQELRKESYMNSRRSCDHLLVLLERDARCAEPLWLDLWREADGYYQKEDLLFPTLRSLKPYYPCGEPSKFLSLAPAIRYCQDTYIAPRVDASLFARLVGDGVVLDENERRARKSLRVALAYYVRAKEGAREERNEALMTADSAMSSALSLIERLFSVAAPRVSGDEKKPVCCCGEGGGEAAWSGDDPCGGFTTFCSLLPGVNRL